MSQEKTTLTFPVLLDASLDLHEALTVFVNDTQLLSRLNGREMKALLEFYAQLEGAINGCCDEEEERREQMFG